MLIKLQSENVGGSNVLTDVDAYGSNVQGRCCTNEAWGIWAGFNWHM